MEELGGWDSMISYYTIDCDMYDRMRMNNYSTEAEDCGPVYDTGNSLDDLRVLYREGDELNSTTFHELQHEFESMTHVKNNGDIGPRNRWQVAQTGGQGEPYYRDMDGFAEALEIQVDAGIAVYDAKWHAGSCALKDAGLKPEDEWKVESVDGHWATLSRQYTDLSLCMNWWNFPGRSLIAEIDEAVILKFSYRKFALHGQLLLSHPTSLLNDLNSLKRS